MYQITRGYTPHSSHHAAAVIVLPCSKCFRDGEGSRNLRRPLGFGVSSISQDTPPHVNTNKYQELLQRNKTHQNTTSVEWLTLSNLEFYSPSNGESICYLKCYLTQLHHIIGVTVCTIPGR
jgi:hypothetical protein